MAEKLKHQKSNNEIKDDLIEWIIENYTNEAGVRSIKRKIEQISLVCFSGKPSKISPPR